VSAYVNRARNDVRDHPAHMRSLHLFASCFSCAPPCRREFCVTLARTDPLLTLPAAEAAANWPRTGICELRVARLSDSEPLRASTVRGNDPHETPLASASLHLFSFPRSRCLRDLFQTRPNVYSRIADSGMG